MTHTRAYDDLQRTKARRTSIPDERLRHLARQLHALGEGPLYRFLQQIAAGADLIPTLETYAALPADLIQAFDGDRLPEPRMVAGGRR